MLEKIKCIKCNYMYSTKIFSSCQNLLVFQPIVLLAECLRIALKTKRPLHFSDLCRNIQPCSDLFLKIYSLTALKHRLLLQGVCRPAVYLVC